MADRSVSVPMTLSDLEKPDERNQFFFRRVLITLVCTTNAWRDLSATAEFLVALAPPTLKTSIFFQDSRVRYPHIYGLIEIVKIRCI